MEIEDLQKICHDLPGTTQNIKWEEHLCFNVGNKMYLITSPDQFPHTASFKTSDELFDRLIGQDGFSPAPYLARYKWVFIDDISRLGQEEWTEWITQSYQLIYSKLPARIKNEIQSG